MARFWNIKKAKEIATQYDVGMPQLAIRYCLQLGMLPLPKSATPEHIWSNAEVNFEISAENMEVLKSVSADDYGDASNFPVYGKSAMSS